MGQRRNTRRLAAVGLLSTAAVAAADQRFDQCTPYLTAPGSADHLGQAQLDVLNWRAPSTHTLNMGSDNYSSQLAANGTTLGEYYNSLTSLFSASNPDGNAAADAINADVLSHFPSWSGHTAGKWISLNEISSGLWPDDTNNGPAYRAWLEQCMAKLHQTYGYQIILWSPFPNPGAHDSDWQNVTQNCFIGVENYLSGAEVKAQSFSVSWCQSQYQSSINSYVARGVARSQIFMSEDMALTTAGNGYGRDGVSFADWVKTITVRNDAMFNCNFAGYISYAWDKNNMLDTEADQIAFEEAYRSHRVVQSEQQYWVTDANGSWGPTTIVGNDGTSAAIDVNWVGGMPVAGQPASFLNAITGPRTITLDGTRAAGKITFDNTNSYTLVPGTGGTLTLDNLGAGATVSVNSGSHTISAPVLLSDNVSISVAGTALTFSGGITDSSGKSITKSGAGTLTLSGTQSYGVGSVLNLNGGTLNLNNDPGTAGSQTLTLNVTAGTLNLNSTQHLLKLNVTGGTVTAGSLSGTGSISVGGGTAAAVASVANFSQSAVTLSSGGSLRVLASPTTQYTNTATTLTIAGSASLDLNNHNLLTSSPASNIRGYLAAGYNGGQWNGTAAAAIISSSAKLAFGGTAARSLGYATGGADSYATNTLAIPIGQTLVKYTTPGDADLSGGTNFNDFLALQNNFSKPGNWTQGDFDYNGTTNFNDFLILQNNFNKSLNANGTVTGEAKAAVSKLSASPTVSAPTVTYILSKNDDGQGNFAAGKFAVYAVDSTADGNHGLASYSVDVLGFNSITNFAPKGIYDAGKGDGSEVFEGFTLLRSANGAFSTGSDPIHGSQDTIDDPSFVQLVYGMGQIAGNLNTAAPAGSTGGRSRVQTSYASKLLIATGTSIEMGSLQFNPDMTNDKANVFIDGTSGATEVANIAGIPEPASLSLVVLAAIGLLGQRRRPTR